MKGIVSFLFNKKVSSPLFGATAALPLNEVMSTPGGIVYGDSSTLNYPPLLSPLQSPRFYASIALVFSGLFALLRQRFVSILRQVKVRDYGFYGFLLLLVLQEVRLTDRLLQDFRPITSGSWFVQDKYIVHYIEQRSFSNPTSSHIHAFHGFGANCLSWRPMLDALAKGVSKTTTFLAHDTPGFGFNPRPQCDSDVTSPGLFPTIYRPLWGAKVSLALAEKEQPVAQRIFMGHSMGSVSAMAAAASTVLRGESNVTLVLVSPAFSIKKSLLNTTAATMDSLQVLEAVRDGVASTVPTPTAIQSRGSRIANVFKSLLSQFRSLYRYPLKLVLRRLVHSDSFWRDGLSAAWAPSSKGGVQMVGPSVAKKLDTTDIFRYKLASMAAHFDDDLLRFVTAQKGSKSGSFPSPEVVPGVDQSSLLAALITHGVHVVIVHGTDDRIVPIRASEEMNNRVTTMLPPNAKGSISMLPLTGYGHIPHEENANFVLKSLQAKVLF